MSSFDLAPGFRCDVDTLVNTRLLVQSNSGGGKSWCIRRILEQTHGKVQQLVIDPEGEFSTLRERFDYILASKHGGDTAADPRSAKLLAERLLELGVSAILDIYELKHHERIAFVRAFLEALVDAPKKLWRPALIVLDEVHVYCPQSDRAESSGAVIDLATRGRKRGFCAVLATQRLSKLHKDAAAECNNKVIGRTGLDVDMNRAGDELGFAGKAERLALRTLKPGEFFAFGPAFQPGVTKIRVGDVKTSHPKAGGRIAFTPPPPTAKVKALLPKLADLPAEAAERQKSIEDLKRELAGLKRDLAASRKGTPAAPAKEKIVEKRVEVPVIKDAQLARLETLTGRLATLAARINAAGTEIAAAVRPARHPAPAAPTRANPPVKAVDLLVTTADAYGVKFGDASRTPRKPPGPGDSGLGKGERVVLIAIAQYPDGATREQLTVLTGYKTSTRNTYVQRLSVAGLCRVAGDRIFATEDGVAALGDDFEPLPTGEDLRAYWLGRLPEGERKILDILIRHYPHAVEREVISEATGYATSSRNTYLQRMQSKRLVVAESGGRVRANANLFE